MSDWISNFMSYTKGLPTPEIFRLWTAISTIAGACERRVWIKTAVNILYPNLYVLLVASPAVGKTVAISKATALWKSTKKIHVAPNSISKAALLDVLLRSDRKLVINGGAGLLEYHSLAISSGEFGVLVPSHDTEFLSVLNDLYDNPPEFADEKRTTKSVFITNPQLNILAGTQPGYLANLLPEEAWSMGFMSRNVMIYAGQGPKVDFFDSIELDDPVLKQLSKDLMAITSTLGEIAWEEPAKNCFRQWLHHGQKPLPEHSKLQHYCGRRNILLAKLAMISAVSRGEGLIITHEDVTRAMDWLFQAESYMPDVFREMIQRSDSQVIQELHLFLWQLWCKEKKPIHESRLVHFLQNRVPSEKVLRVIEIAERSNILNKVAGAIASYTPRPKHEHGLE